MTAVKVVFVVLLCITAAAIFGPVGFFIVALWCGFFIWWTERRKRDWRQREVSPAQSGAAPIRCGHCGHPIIDITTSYVFDMGGKSTPTFICADCYNNLLIAFARQHAANVPQPLAAPPPPEASSERAEVAHPGAAGLPTRAALGALGIVLTVFAAAIVAGIVLDARGSRQAQAAPEPGDSTWKAEVARFFHDCISSSRANYEIAEFEWKNPTPIGFTPAEMRQGLESRWGCPTRQTAHLNKRRASPHTTGMATPATPDAGAGDENPRWKRDLDTLLQSRKRQEQATPAPDSTKEPPPYE